MCHGHVVTQVSHVRQHLIINLVRYWMLRIAWDDPNHKDLFPFLLLPISCLLQPVCALSKDSQLVWLSQKKAWACFCYTAVETITTSSLLGSHGMGLSCTGQFHHVVCCCSSGQHISLEFLDWTGVNFQFSCPPRTCMYVCTLSSMLQQAHKVAVNFWKILNVNLLKAKQGLLQIKACPWCSHLHCE